MAILLPCNSFDIVLPLRAHAEPSRVRNAVQRSIAARPFTKPQLCCRIDQPLHLPCVAEQAGFKPAAHSRFAGHLPGWPAIVVAEHPLWEALHPRWQPNTLARAQ